MIEVVVECAFSRERGMAVEPANNSYLKILEAAATLPDTFSREDLAVAAWRLYPERFGLQGYPDLPNCQQVYCKLYGLSGLIGRGLIEPVEGSMFRMTRAGREELLHPTPPRAPKARTIESVQPEASPTPAAVELAEQAPMMASEVVPAIPVDQFSLHHRVRMLDIEESCVEHRGDLDLSFFRRNPSRHPRLPGADWMGAWDDTHGTRLSDGSVLADHDDYDVLDDLVAAGWVTVHRLSFKRWRAALTDSGWAQADKYRRMRTSVLRSRIVKEAVPEPMSATAAEIDEDHLRLLLQVELFCVDHGGRLADPELWIEPLRRLVDDWMLSIDDTGLITLTELGWSTAALLRRYLASRRRND